MQITFIEAEQLSKYNKDKARAYYLDILDKAIESLIVAESYIYDREISSEYTLEDLYDVANSALKQVRGLKLCKERGLNIEEYRKLNTPETAATEAS